MKHHISIFLAAAAMFIAAGRTAEAQSQGFKLGQWIEIQNSILKELNTSYVDSLPMKLYLSTTTAISGYV